MKTGLYTIIICRKIAPNGIGIDAIEYEKKDPTEIKEIKEICKKENWIIYSLHEIKPNELTI
jgi:hypothetical protein